MKKQKIHLNQIGVAILCTNRTSCTNRLLNSIENHTSMKDWKIFVCDDSSSQFKNDSFKVCKREWINYIPTGERIGIARNTNEAMKALEKFPFKIILNNDVEILHPSWAYIYPIALMKTGYHHFCFQQEGLWGAGTKKRPETHKNVNGIDIKTITDFPQGAILAYDQKAFETVGYFDANRFHSYGFSHWKWSFFISESGIQPPGIHDVIGSNNYFQVHNEPCCTPIDQRIKSYSQNRDLFKQEMLNLKQKKVSLYTSY